MSLIDYLDDEKIDFVEEIVSQWIIRIGDQKINIRITKDAHGYFQFVTSHYYHGSEQAGPYIASAANFTSEKEAIIYARRQVVSFYDPADKNAVWVENTLF
ncbi:hypothetical protein ACFVP8_04010 [Viridibacillus arvi]|uniref:hypothetical protein n=1 Tax=Viridibacillus arvi TaxID=263475 RepID=UPI00369A2CBD